MALDGDPSKAWPYGSLDILEAVRSRQHGENGGVASPRKSVLSAALFGTAIAAVAIVLRLTVKSATGGEQAIFSFPAIVFATLLFGVRAGVMTAAACLAALWYFVLEPTHSFGLGGPSEVVSVVVYLFVAAALIWSIGAMRLALVRYRDANAALEKLVARRTAERNRVWERSHELVAIITSAGVIDAINPALQAKLPGDFEVSPTTNISSLIPQTDWPALDAAYDKLAIGSPSAVFEARLQTLDGEIWVEWTAVSDGYCFYLVGRDVTIERECSLRLQQSQKLELVGQMTGGLVHDFANLLSPITMSLELLRQRHRDDVRTTGLIASARESTSRAELVVQRLMKFARAEKAVTKRLSARALIEQVAPLLRQIVGHRELEIVLGDDLRDIRVDANEFDMALLNLIVNARDATASDGRVQLIANNVDETLMTISIEDNGPGMDAATLRRATEPFFSTKGPDRGTGLGLPMVENFAISAGGSVELRSDPGRGTTVRLFLPTVRKSKLG